MKNQSFERSHPHLDKTITETEDTTQEIMKDADHSLYSENSDWHIWPEGRGRKFAKSHDRVDVHGIICECRRNWPHYSKPILLTVPTK